MTDNIPAGNLGPIRPDELYPLAVLKSRLGWKSGALRTARRDGLRVRRYGNLYYALGTDVIHFLSRDRDA